MRLAAMTAAALVAIAMLGSCAREKGRSDEGASAAAGATTPAPSASPVLPASQSPLDRARSLAGTIEARAASFRTDSGTWSVGDASSTYTVLLDGKQPVMLEEKLSLGERGASFSRFFYENGRVFLYQERGIRMSTNHDRGYPMTVESKLEVEIAFDSAGAVVGSRYAEDGRGFVARGEGEGGVGEGEGVGGSREKVAHHLCLSMESGKWSRLAAILGQPARQFMSCYSVSTRC